MTKWILIRSWHIIRNWTRVPNRAITFCGRTADGETRDEVPAGKTCETCLRNYARSLEPKPVDNDVVAEPVDNDPVPG